MPLSQGARIGSYEITAKLGAGGMGEVYRARDTKLHRDVAIKVLPELFATDSERLARFTREAQTLAALNHPHIAHIHGMEESGRRHALVMELVEGEDLSMRIARGAVPLAEALPIARQIADALDAAHEKGIVHRDLKPANIKVTPDDEVKVLDFGLAKAMGPDGPAPSELSNSPTLTGRATQLGMIIGTAAYMSPEQARGRPVDKRADIWAFGVVLFEMLTGKRMFAGDDVTDVLARVLEREPDWSLIPAAAPPSLRRLLERCLTKDPKARLRDIGEARHALDELIAGRSVSMPAISTMSAPAAIAPPQPRAAAAWIPWALAAILAVVAAVSWLRPAAATTPAGVPPTRTELLLPAGVEFYTAPRISRDSRRVAFVGNREGVRQVYVRALDQPDARPLASTDGAVAVAFSPDSRSLAIITAEAKLRRVNIETAAVEDLASSVDVVGGLHWTKDDRILFGKGTKIAAMPATGGAIVDLVSIDAATETSLGGPMSTPDDSTLLFTSWYGPAGAQRSRVVSVPMAGGARKVVVEDAAYVLGVSEDRVVFQRDTSVYSVPFDQARAEPAGSPVKLMDEARLNPTGGLAGNISPDGHLLFADTRTATGRLSWVSLGGVDRPIAVPVRIYSNPRVSPDGRYVAYSDANSVWTTDLERGSQTKVFTGRDSLTGFPVWAHDGRWIFIRSSTGVIRISADGEGQPEPIKGSIRADYPNGVSSDGSVLLATRILSETSGDIVTIPITGGDAKVLVSTPAYEGGGQFSPDGKWLAYVSNSSSRMEVYLRPVDGGTRYPVSTSGGVGPLWSRDGKRLFFRNGQQFLAVDVTTEPAVKLGAPQVLFERRYAFGPNLTIANYSLSRDGKDFLLVSAGADHLSLIFNWLQTAGR
jgi:Tol biopolymer transport system component/tRNA A-37 threonylcarbamoyl transferase component Bud32